MSMRFQNRAAGSKPGSPEWGVDGHSLLQIDVPVGQFKLILLTGSTRLPLSRILIANTF